MRRFVYRAWLPLLLGSLLLGCSSEATGPELALEQFYRHLNDREYVQAIALYSAESRGVLDDPAAGGGSGFDEWALSETRNGKVKSVQVTGHEGAEERTQVQFEVVYTDGTRVNRSVTLTREDGEWRLGFIS